MYILRYATRRHKTPTTPTTTTRTRTRTRLSCWGLATFHTPQNYGLGSLPIPQKTRTLGFMGQGHGMLWKRILFMGGSQCFSCSAIANGKPNSAKKRKGAAATSKPVPRRTDKLKRSKALFKLKQAQREVALGQDGKSFGQKKKKNEKHIKRPFKPYRAIQKPLSQEEKHPSQLKFQVKKGKYRDVEQDDYLGDNEVEQRRQLFREQFQEQETKRFSNQEFEEEEQQDRKGRVEKKTPELTPAEEKKTQGLGILAFVMKLMEEEKMENIVVLDIGAKSQGWSDIMIIATGLSARHLYATGVRIKSELKRKGIKSSLDNNDEWVIVSGADIIIELFTEKQRLSYDIEKLWVLKKTNVEIFASVDSSEFEESISADEDDVEDVDEKDMEIIRLK